MSTNHIQDQDDRNNFRNYFSDENSNGFTTFQESKWQLQSFMQSLEKQKHSISSRPEKIQSKREKRRIIKNPQSSHKQRYF